uniref:Uncharacterized protein n=1 Tax=Arion vulgaris TaxID=1028688 RepID=A0A0B6ZT29_9EUPU
MLYRYQPDKHIPKQFMHGELDRLVEIEKNHLSLKMLQYRQNILGTSCARLPDVML